MRAGEQFFAPSGYWIVAAQNIGASTWYIRVLDFATWKHRRYDFATEAEARAKLDMWRI